MHLNFNLLFFRCKHSKSFRIVKEFKDFYAVQVLLIIIIAYVDMLPYDVLLRREQLIRQLNVFSWNWSPKMHLNFNLLFFHCKHSKSFRIANEFKDFYGVQVLLIIIIACVLSDTHVRFHRQLRSQYFCYRISLHHLDIM